MFCRSDFSLTTLLFYPLIFVGRLFRPTCLMSLRGWMLCPVSAGQPNRWLTGSRYLSFACPKESYQRKRHPKTCWDFQSQFPRIKIKTGTRCPKNPCRFHYGYPTLRVWVTRTVLRIISPSNKRSL